MFSESDIYRGWFSLLPKSSFKDLLHPGMFNPTRECWQFPRGAPVLSFECNFDGGKRLLANVLIPFGFEAFILAPESKIFTPLFSSEIMFESSGELALKDLIKLESFTFAERLALDVPDLFSTLSLLKNES